MHHFYLFKAYRFNLLTALRKELIVDSIEKQCCSINDVASIKDYILDRTMHGSDQSGIFRI